MKHISQALPEALRAMEEGRPVTPDCPKCDSKIVRQAKVDLWKCFNCLHTWKKD